MIQFVKSNINITVASIGLFTAIGCNFYYDYNYDPLIHDDPNADCFPCYVWFFGRKFAAVLGSYVLYRLMPSFVSSLWFAVTMQDLTDLLFNDWINNPIIEYVAFAIIVVVLYYRARKINRSKSNIKGNGK